MTKALLAYLPIVLLAGGAATAADLPIKAPAPAAIAPAWTGFYAGGSLGARWADNDWRSSDVFPTFPPAGIAIVQLGNTEGAINSAAARIGIYGGYNWQFAHSWVAGLEADLGWADNSSTANPAPGTVITQNGVFITNSPSGTVKETWDGSVRARLGKLIGPDTLLFATGGLAVQQVELTATCSVGSGADFCLNPLTESHAKTMTGWTLGGGVERRVWGNWLARVEYRYADLGTFDQLFFPPCVFPGFLCEQRFTAHVHVRTQTANVGLAYKF